MGPLISEETFRPGIGVYGVIIVIIAENLDRTVEVGVDSLASRNGDVVVLCC